MRQDWLRNRAVWRDAGYNDGRYAVEQERRCECAPPYRATAFIGANGVDSVAVPASEPDGDAAEWAQTVEEAFALVGQAILESSALEVEYDPSLGYPTRIDIDWDVDVADEEVTWTLSDLRPGW